MVEKANEGFLGDFIPQNNSRQTFLLAPFLFLDGFYIVSITSFKKEKNNKIADL